MSRKLSANQRPKGQSLHIQESEILRKLSKPSGDCICVQYKHTDNPPFLRFSKRKNDKSTFSIQKNVFIDSYYPKLQSDISDSSRKSRFSFTSKESTNIGDSSEKSSRRTYEASQRDQKSSVSFDSKTYTLFSNPLEERENSSDEKAETWVIDEEKEKEDENGKSKSALDIFSQLHKRIETLEDILQQALANAVQSKECDCVKQNKIKFQKTKNGVNKVSSVGDTTKGKGNSDTESELRNIKKRLRNLERKLRNTKITNRNNSDSQTPNPRLKNIPSERNNNYPKEEFEKAQKKDKICQSSRLSESEVILPSEMFLFATKSGRINERESGEEKTKNKVKRKFISKYKRLKRKCSRMIHPKRKTSQTQIYRIPIGEKDNTSVGGSSCTEKTTLCYVKCPKEKREKKNLCKKNSITNILTQNTDDEVKKVYLGPPWMEESNTWSSEPCWMSFSGRCCPQSPCEECLYWKKTKENKRRKMSLFRNPIEILKKGGKIRIPVLFEEICKSSTKSTQPEHKVPTASMRFVLVEENQKHQLGKLVKNLSERTSHHTLTEQYVFGVTKCSCDNKLYNLNSGRRSENKKKKKKKKYPNG